MRTSKYKIDELHFSIFLKVFCCVYKHHWFTFIFTRMFLNIFFTMKSIELLIFPIYFLLSLSNTFAKFLHSYDFLLKYFIIPLLLILTCSCSYLVEKTYVKWNIIDIPFPMIMSIFSEFRPSWIFLY